MVGTALEPLARGYVRFRVHGPDPSSDELPAAVFAEKLTSLVRAIRAADKAVNGGASVHEYMIAKLASSTPTALLVERPVPRLRGQLLSGRSGIAGFQDCVDAITFGQRERALSYGSCINQIDRLSKGSRNRFGYAEVWTATDSIVRVDPFLSERVRAVVREEVSMPALAEVSHVTSRDWFEGKAYGSFDGEVRAVDLRGALPEIKLILTAGGKQIDCVCRSIDIDTIRSALNRRVRVAGVAIYDGTSGLPRRLEANSVEQVQTHSDLNQWLGAFEPLALDAWEGND